MAEAFDAVLLLSFGGPEGPDDVLPFLENVLRGKRVPPERLLDVAQHYELFGGVSPINAQNRALLAALVNEFRTHGLSLPLYWGNRNWHPMLADTLREMADDGVRHALAFVTSAYRSYSGCRQYLEDIQRAQMEVGPTAPQVSKLRAFFNHPGFIEPMVERVAAAYASIEPERREAAPLVFTAHSIPESMARGSSYVADLTEACRLVAQRSQRTEWTLVYQSRSGPPSQPWLGPDVGDYLAELSAGGTTSDIVLAPIGFLSEHMEVIYDLDVEVQALCDHMGLNLVRAGVVGSHPRFVQMVRELVEERIDPNRPKLALGSLGPSHDCCPADCCRPGPAAPLTAR